MSSTGCLEIQHSATPCAAALAMSSAQRVALTRLLGLPVSCCCTSPLAPYTMRGGAPASAATGPGQQMVTLMPLQQARARQL